jgi:Ion channel inhibitory toxin
MSSKFLSAVVAACTVFYAVALAGSTPSHAEAPAAPAGSPQNPRAATPAWPLRAAAACYPLGHRCKTADECCDGLVCIGRYKGDTNYYCRR